MLSVTLLLTWTASASAKPRATIVILEGGNQDARQLTQRLRAQVEWTLLETYSSETASSYQLVQEKVDAAKSRLSQLVLLPTSGSIALRAVRADSGTDLVQPDCQPVNEPLMLEELPLRLANLNLDPLAGDVSLTFEVSVSTNDPSDCPPSKLSIVGEAGSDTVKLSATSGPILISFLCK